MFGRWLAIVALLSYAVTTSAGAVNAAPACPAPFAAAPQLSADSALPGPCVETRLASTAGEARAELLLGRAVFSVAQPLLPAWELLVSLPELGDYFRELAPASGVRVAVGLLPGDTGGVYRHGQRTVVLNAALLREQTRAIVPVLAHELHHAIEAAIEPERRKDCVAQEVGAFILQARIWQTLTRDDPTPRTARETAHAELLRLYRNEGEEGLSRRVADHPGYQRQCHE